MPMECILSGSGRNKQGCTLKNKMVKKNHTAEIMVRKIVDRHRNRVERLPGACKNKGAAVALSATDVWCLK